MWRLLCIITVFLSLLAVITHSKKTAAHVQRLPCQEAEGGMTPSNVELTALFCFRPSTAACPPPPPAHHRCPARHRRPARWPWRETSRLCCLSVFIVLFFIPGSSPAEASLSCHSYQPYFFLKQHNRNISEPEPDRIRFYRRQQYLILWLTRRPRSPPL